jgi:hypothetical protein
MPRPPAVRLVTKAKRYPRAALPFGLPAWTADAHAIAVLLQAEAELEGDLLDQIPSARSLAAATPVFVLGDAARAVSSPWLAWARSDAIRVPRGPRCNAMLMRGYVQLGAGIDPTSGVDLVWGFSSPC